MLISFLLFVADGKDFHLTFLCHLLVCVCTCANARTHGSLSKFECVLQRE